MSELPLFTIGIPTFNRSHFLRSSIQAALNQTYKNIQIVVSDNASNDDTETVVRSFRDNRIDYVRLNSHSEAMANFRNCVTYAKGNYFSWLQDDDQIFRSFAARAVEVLSANDGAVYLGSAFASRSFKSLTGEKVYGPPLPMDWASERPRRISTNCLAALSLTCSVAIPPVVAFKTSVLQEVMAAPMIAQTPLFAERLILLVASSLGPAICDPIVSGIFFQHAAQSNVLWSQQRNRYNVEYIKLTRLIESLVRRDFGSDLGELTETLESISSDTLESWIAMSKWWPTELEFPQRVRQVLDSIGNKRIKTTTSQRLRENLKDVVPPVLLRIFRRLSIKI